MVLLGRISGNVKQISLNKPNFESLMEKNQKDKAQFGTKNF